MVEFKGKMSVEEERGNSSMFYKAYRQAILKNSLIFDTGQKKIEKLFNIYTLTML